MKFESSVCRCPGGCGRRKRTYGKTGCFIVFDGDAQVCGEHALQPAALAVDTALAGESDCLRGRLAAAMVHQLDGIRDARCSNDPIFSSIKCVVRAENKRNTQEKHMNNVSGLRCLRASLASRMFSV